MDTAQVRSPLKSFPQVPRDENFDQFLEAMTLTQIESSYFRSVGSLLGVEEPGRRLSFGLPVGVEAEHAKAKAKLPLRRRRRDEMDDEQIFARRGRGGAEDEQIFVGQAIVYKIVRRAMCAAKAIRPMQGSESTKQMTSVTNAIKELLVCHEELKKTNEGKSRLQAGLETVTTMQERVESLQGQQRSLQVEHKELKRSSGSRARYQAALGTTAMTQVLIEALQGQHNALQDQ